MKRLFFLLLLVAGGFYVAWPAYSLYELGMGLKNNDDGAIQNKIAWQQVRDNLRPALTKKVEGEMAAQAGKAGFGDLLKSEDGKKLAPQLVDQIIKKTVTPQGLKRLLANDGKIDVGSLGVGSLLGGLGKKGGGSSGGGSLLDIVGKVGGIANSIPGGKDTLGALVGKALGGKTKDKPKAENGEKFSFSKYGLSNIKSFRFLSPWEFEIGVAKDPEAKEADITAGMGFQDMDWKVTRVVPKL